MPRAIYISDFKVLGGNLGGDLVFRSFPTASVMSPRQGVWPPSTPMGSATSTAKAPSSWHPGQFDIGFAAGFWAPTGDSAGLPQTQPGLGYWTPELTLGVTWYPDEEKTWAISLLNRYEINSEYRDTGITPGQAWTLEWGVSKSVLKTLELGVVGYYQQRITASTGNQPLAAEFFPYSRAAAVGPEVNLFIPCAKLFVSLRYNYEFMADNRSQGHTVALVLTKVF